ncbi:NAD(P)/FAD-dependent oxidoreductase [Comamonas sp. 17RB]|uniref:NAD(P)/FAD-dependent oxidoreductase n=1 Tax=Comamonas sp. 17RB TaxID=3047025 RepID=UPI0024B743BB|nr:NAD(P)/FAD-dependent oxidoreductase [Comamonas sp. 17RB]MDI9854826.1 NAD(P)/FAD-dependent oxidoreductase [Comamonas sp. 17RB]
MPLQAAAPQPADTAAPITTDVVVLGAGPVGLFQVFELGLLGLQAHVVDALPHAGGQCAELYPDKPIYDIPGIRACTGRELSERLQQQAAPFSPVYHLGQQVEQLQRLADGRLLLTTHTGTRFATRSLILAAGVGAFVPRALKVEGADALVGSQLFYHPHQLDHARSRDVVVLGGDETAVAAAVACATAQDAASTTLLHRRDVFTGPDALLAQLADLRTQGRIQVVAGQPGALQQAADGRLQALEVARPDGSTQALRADLLLAYLGISPKLGPIAEWGLELERKQLPVDTARFATAEPGIYAVGDINTYPGKRKLILCGFHEATLAAFAVAEQLSGQAPLLQYTTSSSHLHALLGVHSAD